MSALTSHLFSYLILKSHLETEQYLLLVRGNCFQKQFHFKHFCRMDDNMFKILLDLSKILKQFDTYWKQLKLSVN